MFVVPMTVLVLATLWFDKDFLVGIYIALGSTAIYILATRMMDMHDTFDTIIDGFKTMVEPLGVLVAAVGFIYVGSLFGLTDPWVPFVALTMWGAMGMKMEQAPGIFLGGAVGLLISLGMEALPDLYGDWAVIIPLVAIILAISCHIKGWLPLFCNFGLFIFLTIGGADVFLDQRPQLGYLKNLAFGAVCFWIIPWAILKLKTGGSEDAGAAT